MLVTPHDLVLRKPIALTRDQAQWFLDGEVFFANQAMSLHVRCIPCALAGHHAHCEANADNEFTEIEVTCRCRERKYRGLGLDAPLPPRPIVKRQDAPMGEKYSDPLDRDTMRQIEAYEALLKSLELEGGMICFRCNTTVKRNRDDIAEYNLECTCTSRTYPLSAASAQSH